MSATPEHATSSRPDLPLKYVGGDPALDLVNTVDWTSDGPDNERIPDYERLTRWAEGAGVLSRAEGRRLREAAAARPDAARAAHRRALELRDVLQRLLASVAIGERHEAAWQELDRWLGETLQRLTLAPVPATRGTRRAAAWRWRGAEDGLDWFLYPVVRSAAELLASTEAHRLRVCDGDECGWMFVDRSRNRLRRWCEMETCGTAAKSRRRRERQARRARG